MASVSIGKRNTAVPKIWIDTLAHLTEDLKSK
jgi:hypothetical protein